MKRCYGCFEILEKKQETCPYCGYVEGTPPEEAVHMEPGTLLSERYIVGKVIGYGGFGVTYIGWDSRLEKRVAIKEYMPSEFSTRMPGRSQVSIFGGVKKDQFDSGLKKFVEEAKRLSKFQKEEGIVKIYDCISENDTAYIIMEYLEGETLSELLKREKVLSERDAIDILTPIMNSLEAVHEEGIIHRDIAPDNIFITKDGKVKLIDFGAARFATTSYSRSLTVIIKPGYSAEEQYRSKSDQGPYTDVYSLAATLYKMITGETPPDALERRAKIENAKKDILQEPHKLNKNISLVTENAILNALNIRIEDRTPTVQKFIKDLKSAEPVKRVYGKIKHVDLYRMPMWIKILVPSMLGVFLLFGSLIAAGVIKISSFKTKVVIPDGYTVVPSIEGLDIENATKELSNSKLNYTAVGNLTSEYVDAGLIVYQNPDGGRTLPINSLIEITVCRGTGEVEIAINGVSKVPIFIWSEENTAIEDFKTAGLDPTVNYIFDENVAAGQVIKATDDKGNEIKYGDELPEGSKVILYVSKGAEGFAMPDVIGMTEEEAKSLLEQKGLVTYITSESTDSATAGTVFEQSIAAGETVKLGTEVTIKIAKEPDDSVETDETIIESEETTASAAPVYTPTNTPKPTPTPTSTPIPESYVSYTCTVVFDADGGYLPYYDEVEDEWIYELSHSYTYTVGDTLGYIEEPELYYRHFVGWKCNGSYVGPDTVVYGDMYIVAQWEINEDWEDWGEWDYYYTDDLSNLPEGNYYDGILVDEFEYTYTLVTRIVYCYSRYESVDFYDEENDRYWCYVMPYHGERNGYDCYYYYEITSDYPYYFIGYTDGFDTYYDEWDNIWFNEYTYEETVYRVDYRLRSRVMWE